MFLGPQVETQLPLLSQAGRGGPLSPAQRLLPGFPPTVPSSSYPEAPSYHHQTGVRARTSAGLRPPKGHRDCTGLCRLTDPQDKQRGRVASGLFGHVWGDLPAVWVEGPG